MDNWDDLKYWNTGEWQVIQERLDDLDKKGTLYNPARHLLFHSLDTTPFDSVKVVIMGQDPYPVRGYATGHAFSIPRNSIWDWPPTLRILMKEYADDLHLPEPKNGNLEKWASQGVLLWNAIPSCEAGKSMSHDWTEWSYLTEEIIQSLSNKGGITFAFLGAVARRYNRIVDIWNNSLIETGHPSPRGNLTSKVKFSGSRLYTDINARLIKHSQIPIDWNLEGASRSKINPREKDDEKRSEQAGAKAPEVTRHILQSEETGETIPF